MCEESKVLTRTVEPQVRSQMVKYYSVCSLQSPVEVVRRCGGGLEIDRSEDMED
jgi:hypothetical protein